MSRSDTHEYQPDSSVRDWHGRFLCVCGLPKANALHEVPEVSADVRRLDARKLGEKDPKEGPA